MEAFIFQVIIVLAIGMLVLTSLIGVFLYWLSARKPKAAGQNAMIAATTAPLLAPTDFEQRIQDAVTAKIKDGIEAWAKLHPPAGKVTPDEVIETATEANRRIQQIIAFMQTNGVDEATAMALFEKILPFIHFPKAALAAHQAAATIPAAAAPPL